MPVLTPDETKAIGEKTEQRTDRDTGLTRTAITAQQRFRSLADAVAWGATHAWNPHTGEHYQL